MSKKLDKKLDEAFVPSHIATDKTIRDATYRNIKVVESSDIPNIHKRILDILKIKSKSDSKYYDVEEFHNLLKEARVLTKRTPDDVNEFDFF